jgi:hypothetical protein
MWCGGRLGWSCAQAAHDGRPPRACWLHVVELAPAVDGVARPHHPQPRRARPGGLLHAAPSAHQRGARRTLLPFLCVSSQGVHPSCSSVAFLVCPSVVSTCPAMQDGDGYPIPGASSTVRVGFLLRLTLCAADSPEPNNALLRPQSPMAADTPGLRRRVGPPLPRHRRCAACGGRRTTARSRRAATTTRCTCGAQSRTTTRCASRTTRRQ